MKLGCRLSSINALVVQHYQTIWDCCCDHGLLGMSLLERNASNQVVFVDILKPQMQQLEQKLRRDFPRDFFEWKIICEDLSKIIIPNVQSQLFIIAGVGGDKTIEFINALSVNGNSNYFDFLICSVHGNYQVRKVLIELGFKLINEKIVQENKRFYELIHVSKTANLPLSAVGNSMWDWTNHDHIAYWKKTVTHFQKKTKANPNTYKPILDAYRSLR